MLLIHKWASQVATSGDGWGVGVGVNTWVREDSLEEEMATHNPFQYYYLEKPHG